MTDWSYASVFKDDGFDDFTRYCLLQAPGGAVQVGRVVTPHSVSGPDTEEYWNVIGLGVIDGDLVQFETGTTYTPADDWKNLCRVTRCPISNDHSITPETGTIVAEFPIFEGVFLGEPGVASVIDGVGVVVGADGSEVYVVSAFFDGGDPALQVIKSSPENSQFVFARGVASNGDGTFQLFAGVYDSFEWASSGFHVDQTFAFNSSDESNIPVDFYSPLTGTSDLPGYTSAFNLGYPSASAAGFLALTSANKGFNNANLYDSYPATWHERLSASSARFLATNDNAGKIALIDYEYSVSGFGTGSISFEFTTTAEQDLGDPLAAAVAIIGIDPGDVSSIYSGWVESGGAPPVTPRFWTSLKSAQEII